MILNDLKHDVARFGIKGNLFNIVISFFHRAGFRALVFFRISNYLRKRKLKLLAIILDKISHHLTHCWISSTAEIGPGFMIAHVSGVIIGGKVVIGRNCDIRQNTTLGGNNGKCIEGRTQPIVGNNVSIGCSSSVLGPISIVDNVQIGAHTLVIKSIEQQGVYFGVPAKRK